MTSAIEHLVASGGLLAIFVLMTAESCGVPFPSEVVMPLAGFTASAGKMSLVGAILVGALANVIGSLIAWFLARQWGEPLLLGPGRYVGIRRDHVELADRWFQRHGLLAVLVGRVLPVIRTYISFPAGMARVEPVRFAVLTFVGALPWCAALAIAGYKVGQSWDRVSAPIEKAAIVIAVLAVVAVAAWYVRGRQRARAAGEV